MDYIEVSFTSEDENAYEVLTATLADIGFESFVEEEDDLKAYIPAHAFDKKLVDAILDEYSDHFRFIYTVHEIAHQNWNEVWESNFQPITVEHQLRVRATFHQPDPSYPMELIIQPKMSFGTGHHATTWLVMDAMLRLDLRGKKVMDFGTGTGILAILAKQLGADECFAVDNDPQCVENAGENMQLNNTPDIKLALGDIKAFGEGDYDLVIGNITRNVILDFLPEISSRLKPGGLFLASGFYEQDLEVLQPEATQVGMHLQTHKTKDQWCMAIFYKD